MERSASAEIYTTTNFTCHSVTEVGALSAAGWAWSARGRQTLWWEVGVAGWAGRGHCTASSPECQAGRNGSGVF